MEKFWFLMSVITASIMLILVITWGISQFF